MAPELIYVSACKEGRGSDTPAVVYFERQIGALHTFWFDKTIFFQCFHIFFNLKVEKEDKTKKGENQHFEGIYQHFGATSKPW